MENMAVYVGLAVLAIALMCGLGDVYSGPNDYGQGFGSAVTGVVAMATVVGMAIMVVLAVKGLIKK